MRDWERAQAHYRSAERYAAAGNDDKAASHAQRAWEIDRQSRFGGLKKDLGRLFGKKGAEKQGKHRDDKPVPDVPNVQATQTAAKPVPGVPNVQATHTVANVLNAGNDKLHLFSENTQDVFDYVLRVGAAETGHSVKIEGMSIFMRKEDGQSHVCIAVGDTTVSEPFKIGVRTGESLYNVARAIDWCARKLQEKGLIDADRRLFLQRDLMSQAHIEHLAYIERAAYGSVG
jgi:hypothetical protein